MKSIEKLVNLWYQSYNQLEDCEHALERCMDVIENADMEFDLKVPGSSQEYSDRITHWPIDFNELLFDLFPDLIFKQCGGEWIIVSGKINE